MHALHKGQDPTFNPTDDLHGEAGIIERAFGIGPSALAEAVALIDQNLENHKAAGYSTSQPTGFVTKMKILNRAGANSSVSGAEVSTDS